MDNDLDLIDLGDAKEQTKGWIFELPREDSSMGPWKQD